MPAQSTKLVLQGRQYPRKNLQEHGALPMPLGIAPGARPPAPSVWHEGAGFFLMGTSFWIASTRLSYVKVRQSRLALFGTRTQVVLDKEADQRWSCVGCRAWWATIAGSSVHPNRLIVTVATAAASRRSSRQIPRGASCPRPGPRKAPGPDRPTLEPEALKPSSAAGPARSEIKMPRGNFQHLCFVPNDDVESQCGFRIRPGDHMSAP